MNATMDSQFEIERLADIIVGKYKGFVKYVEGSNRLGTDCNAWMNYQKENEVAVQVTRISNDVVDILFYGVALPDFVFTRNTLSKDEKTSRIFIEGDWVTGWGILGWVDIINKNMIIDINPVQYSQTPNSGINPGSLMSRYVMSEQGSPQHYKTVFSLEFEGIQQ